jgi:hypothetical protein
MASKTLNRIHNLYYKAQNADNAYWTAMLARYGNADECYRMAGSHLPWDLHDLRQTKIEADEAYLNACRAARA